MKATNRVYVRRKFNCSVSELFDWLVKPDLIVKWFGPEHLTVGRVQTDVQVGGQYSIELKSARTASFFIRGEYLEIRAPELLTFSFEYGGLPSAPPKSTVKIRLEQIAERESFLSLTQYFDTIPSDMVRRTKTWVHMLRILDENIKVPKKLN